MTTVTPASGLLLPGLIGREPGLETYWVRPGGVTGVYLAGGDRLDVVDRQGRQTGELTVLGAGDPLGVTADAPASVLQELARTHRRGGATGPDTTDTLAVGQVLDELAAHGVDPAEAMAVRLFGTWSTAGDRVGFTAAGRALVLVAAPVQVMSVEDLVNPNPGSDLVLEVRRSTPRARGERPLPPPLADPVLDLRVDAATACAYEVPEGHFIQVIDVEGGQCSDFLAFDARRLQDGVERGLDSTVTRTRMGAGVPQPGLFSAFLDQDAHPLVRVVQDTVGRHDAFLLACTAAYYESLGYFGHVNCTDNFNARLGPYGIAPRPAGWAALNIFYNTQFDANTIVFDEPWSRPGDFVLLRAERDLVCASSACPDDVDPANAWVPTDVHVRVYPPERKFAVAMGHRVTPDGPTVMTRQTAFHDRTTAVGARHVEYRGFWLPSFFTGHGAEVEYHAVRERVGVMDLSPLRKWEVLGPDAEALLQWVCTRNIRKLPVGGVVYSAVCTDTGGMLDDCTVFRLTSNTFRFVGGDPYDGDWLREQARRRGLDRVWVNESTDQLPNLAVQGPASRELLSPLIWTPPTQPALESLGWFRFTIGRLGGREGPPLMVSRTGYSGELGYELWMAPTAAVQVWDAVWEAGQPHGLAPVGLDALDMLRIEAGLVFAGYEFTDQTDPFEAGVGFTVPLKTKAEDFLGREALQTRKAHPQRTLVGLELEGNEPAVHGDCVHIGRAQVGVITSATRSPALARNIALCRIAVQHAEPGTAVEVGKLDGHRKRITARVVPFPFYDPDKTRVKS